MMALDLPAIGANFGVRLDDPHDSSKKIEISGTLGCFVKKGNSYYLLSNAHVLSIDPNLTSHPVLHPSHYTLQELATNWLPTLKEQLKNCTSAQEHTKLEASIARIQQAPVAKLTQALRGNWEDTSAPAHTKVGIDAAIAQLDPGTQFKQDYSSAEEVAKPINFTGIYDSYDIDDDIMVYKYGSVTAQTRGRCREPIFIQGGDYLKDKWWNYPEFRGLNQFQISPPKSGDFYFAHQGNSGSVALSEDGLAVGLIHSVLTFSGFAIATPFKAIVRAFGVELVKTADGVLTQ